MPSLPRKLLYFAKDGNDVLPPAAVRQRWGFTPAGVNFYYGLNAAAAEHLRQHGTALRENHRRFLDLVRQALREEGREAFLVNLGVWPFEPGMPYEWVRDHPELVRQLAAELGRFQSELKAASKRLEVVVRYASEMNDPMKPGQPWGRPHGAWDPAHAAPFRETFRLVRGIFREAASEVRFAFSPALRADHTGVRYDMIADFWPGKEWVDVVSGTWYVGQAAHLEPAAGVLERYVRQWQPEERPFGLDEVGGIHGEEGNDAALQEMFGVLAGMKARLGLDLEYATLFLHGKWAKDATLRFLAQPD